MPERQPDPSANTTQFRAFVHSNQTAKPDSSSRKHSSTIALAAAIAILLVILIVALLAF